MDLANLPNDPRREPDVPALIHEIRRERMVELYDDGFRGPGHPPLEEMDLLGNAARR